MCENPSKMNCPICKNPVGMDEDFFVYCEHCEYSWIEDNNPEDDVTKYDILEDNLDD